MKYALSITHFLRAADKSYMKLSFMTFVEMALRVKLVMFFFFFLYCTFFIFYARYIE